VSEHPSVQDERDADSIGDLHSLIGPLVLMKFTLTYSGSLESSGNKSKLVKVWAIRNALHLQLAELWQTHPVLSGLGLDAGTEVSAPLDLAIGRPPSWHTPLEKLPEVRVSLENKKSSARTLNLITKPIKKSGFAFVPIVRESLALACDLDITFLRKEEPGSLVFQGGDIDGRLKTLFDALRVPDGAEIKEHKPDYTPNAQPLYCLMEQDALITGYKVRSDRLLTAPGKDEHEVHLVVEVTIRVMRIRWENIGFLGE
jgi:hypothetical protein